MRSTRCQVQVIEVDRKLTLYHHCDGYPSNMVKLFKLAYKAFNGSWEAGRVGKVASKLCKVDDYNGFEPLDYHTLHGDIEWYYKINVTGKEGKFIGSKQSWELSVYIASHDGTPENPGALVFKGSIEEADGDKIEREASDED